LVEGSSRGLPTPPPPISSEGADGRSSGVGDAQVEANSALRAGAGMPGALTNGPAGLADNQQDRETAPVH